MFWGVGSPVLGAFSRGGEISQGLGGFLGGEFHTAQLKRRALGTPPIKREEKLRPPAFRSACGGGRRLSYVKDYL